jgi:anti-sigma factor RsiW
MSCEALRNELEAYADGELASANAKSLEAHLDSCPVCTAEVLRIMQLKRLTHNAGLRYEPSAAFRAKIEKKIAQPKRAWFTWPALAAVAATAVIIAVVALGLWFRTTQRDQTLAQLADMHVAALASPNQVDVVSSERHTVKPWFQGKLPFTFDLPELSGSPYKLLGGRVAYMDHSPGAHLLFELRKHEISVFIFPDSMSKGMRAFGSGEARRMNFNLNSWSQNGLRYFVVGDASREDVEGLAELLKRAGQR